MAKNKTLIIGGTFRKKNGTLFVQRRSWEMLRLFSDQMEAPVFGMVEYPSDETLNYAIPYSIDIIEIPYVQGKRKVLATALNRGLTRGIRDAIDGSHAVYIRHPAWECFNFFNYAYKKKKKIITSLHGDWVDAVKQQQGGAKSKLINFLLALYIDKKFKQAARTSEVLFCVGKELVKKYGIYGRHTVEFANYLHTESDIAAPRTILMNAPYRVLYVGGLEERKGLEYLISALAHLKKKGILIELWIIGEGPLKDYLQNKVTEAGLENTVMFKGYLQYGPELLELYRKADIFVLPSVASEGLAKVLMEAMSQAVPVIATDVGSTRHMLRNGDAGILVEKRNSAAISNAIELLINNSSVRERYILKGLDIARRSTTEIQKNIIKDGIAKTVPEILGTPAYLKNLEQHDS